jgi:hypothetical protein
VKARRECSTSAETVDYARRTARDPSLRQPPLRMTEGAGNRTRSAAARWYATRIKCAPAAHARNAPRDEPGAFSANPWRAVEKRLTSRFARCGAYGIIFSRMAAGGGLPALTMLLGASVHDPT